MKFWHLRHDASSFPNRHLSAVMNVSSKSRNVVIGHEDGVRKLMMRSWCGQLHLWMDWRCFSFAFWRRRLFFSAVRWNSRESLVSQELEWWTTSTRSNYWWMHANGTACDEPYPYCLFAFLFSDLPERFERGEDLWAIFVRVCSRKRLLTLVILRCLCYGIALKIWWQAA